MNWLLVAILARFVEGSSAVIDKRILKKSFSNPVGYAFWLGILGLAALILVPFGFARPSPTLLTLAITTGIVYIAAMLFYFSALFYGEASGTVVLLGALSPLSTLLWSTPILHSGLSGTEMIPFAFLVMGSAILFFTTDRTLRFKVLGLLLVSVVLFGLSNVLTKLVFTETNFVSGFVIVKIGSAVGALLLLLHRRGREKIAAHGAEHFGNKTGYFVNRAYAGVGSFLIYYAISLGAPALVDATLGIQFAFVFLGGWLFLGEKFGGWVLAGKIAAVVLVSFAIVWLAVGQYLRASVPDPNRPIAWGVTFSEKFSKLMSLDWKENYNAILGDLGAKRLRLVAYWDLIETQKGEFDFTDLDYQMKRAQEAGAKVILVIGEKAPRWPECHFPSWVKEPTDAGRRTELPPYLRAIVSHYKNDPALLYWQVENEPFLDFGNCPTMDTDSLAREIELVKSLDPSHLVLTTDGGEFGRWYYAAKLGDIFGTTMYRRVHSDTFGYFQYPLPPEYFRLKSAFVHWLTSQPEKQFLVIELGAEPWLQHQLYETSLTDQAKVFDLPFFKDTIVYAKNSGFNDYYLWGAEWWYWMKTKHGDSSFWDYAGSVIRSGTK